MKALIMGGGMAGLATAVNLIDQGIEVELIESDEIFGGRANSWLDKDGDMIDNALHVFFPYYVNLLNFFKKMGIEKNIVWKSQDFYYAQEDGNQPVLHIPNLPAPLHAGMAFFYLMKSYKGIPKWKMIKAMITCAGMMGISRKKLDELDRLSWAEWTIKNGPEGAFKMFEPAIYGLTFTDRYAISVKVMLNWLLKVAASAKSSRVGFANGGLGEIWVQSCVDYIKKKGGACEIKKEVSAINVKDGKIESVTVNGKEKKTADIYVSAMSPYALRKIMPAESYRLHYFEDLTHFEEAASMSIQIWYDRKITDVDVTFFSSDVTFNTYADLSNVLPHIFKGGSMMEMVIAPAEQLRHLPDEIIFEKCRDDIKKLFPKSREATIKKWVLVRQRQNVYKPTPGMESHRPFQRSPYPNFYLTGDWTKTHVSSGGMEATIWNANKCSELVIQDKLGKTVPLNTEFKPGKGLLPLVRPMMFAAKWGLRAAAVIALVWLTLKAFGYSVGLSTLVGMLGL